MPINHVGTDIGKTVKYLKDNSKFAMFLTLSGLEGKKLYSFSGTIKTAKDNNPFCNPY